MPDSANLELTFSARQDASVRQAFLSIRKLITNLNSTVSQFSKTMERLATENVNLKKKIEDSAKAADTQKKKISESTKAMDAAISRSTSFEQTLAKINKTYKAGTAEYGKAYQALVKTEKAFQSSQKTVDQLQRRIDAFNREMDELIAKASSGELDDLGLEKAERRLKQLEKRIAIDSEAIRKIPRSGVSSDFDYAKTFDKNLADMYPSLDRLQKKFTAIGERTQWVNDYYKYLTTTFATGSKEQEAGLRKLEDAWKDYSSKIKQYDRMIKDAQIDAKGLTGVELDNVNTRIRELQTLKSNFTNSFSVENLNKMDSYTPAIEKFSKGYMKLLAAGDDFGKLARQNIELFQKEKISAQELANRMTALGSSYNKYNAELNKAKESGKYSADQLAKLSESSTKLAATNVKTAAGMKNLFNQVLGITEAVKPATTAIDRMVTSISSMARYAMASFVGYGLINSFTNAINAAKEYDQALKNLQAITGATNREIGLLGDEIKKVAVETRYGMREVADGAVIIGQAGFSAIETASILGSTMQLAQGSMSSVAASADLLTTVIASFNLRASDAATVADTMAAAMNYSKLDIDKLRTAFNYVGPVAMDAGVSLNDMTSILMVLANNGMRASTVGTSLRNVFSQLLSPSKALRAAFKGNEEDLAKIQDRSTDVIEKFKILNDVLGTSADLYKMFGLRAAGTVSILMKYPAVLEEMRNGLYTMGMAESMAEKQMEGFGNRVANLNAALEVFAVSAMEKPSKVFSALTLGLTEFIQLLTKGIDTPIGQAVASLATLAASVTAVTVGFKLLSSLFGAIGLSGVISTFAGTVGRATAAINAFGAASLMAQGTSRGLATVVAGSLASVGPWGVAIAAVSTALIGLTSYIMLSTDAEQEQYKQTAKNIRQRQEELGLIKAYLDANKQNIDQATKLSNISYVAGKIPDLAEELLSSMDPDYVASLLEVRMKQNQEQIVQYATQAINTAAARINALTEKRQSITAALSTPFDSQSLSAFGLTEADIDMVTSAMSKAADSMAGDLSKISEEIVVYRDEIKKNFSDIVLVARDAATQQAEINRSLNSEWVMPDEFLRSFIDQRVAFTALDEVTKQYIQSLADVAVMQWDFENHVKGATIQIATLTDAMRNDPTLQEYTGFIERLTAAYEKQDDVIKNKLIKSYTSYQKAVKKINESELSDKEKDTQLSALSEEYAKKWTDILNQTSKDELSWLDTIYKYRIDHTKRVITDKESQNKELTRLDKEYAEARKEVLRRELESQLSLASWNPELADAENIKLLLTPELNMEYLDKLRTEYPNLWQAMVDTGILKILVDLATTADKAESPKPRDTSGGRSSFGKAERKRIEALKTQLDYENKVSELAYEKGTISYEEYNNRKLASDRKLLDERKKQVDSLLGKASNEEERAVAEKYRMDYLKDEADYELNLLKSNLEVQFQLLEQAHNRKMTNLDTEAAKLESTDMNAYQREERLAEISLQGIRDEIKLIEDKIALTTNQDDKEELLNELQTKKNELLRDEYSLRRQIYENATRYIEEEYRYGLASREQYLAYLKKQQAEGEGNPYQLQEDMWSNTLNPMDGFKLGIAQVAQDAKTLNETLAEGVTTFRDSWNSTMDSFVDSWWDSTKSASDVFNDFVEDVIKSWQKLLMKGFSDMVFSGVAQMLPGVGTQATMQGQNPYMSTLSSILGMKPASSPAVGNNGDTAATAVTTALAGANNALTATANTVTTEVTNAATQSTSLLQYMVNGASGLWGFLSNGFTSFWSTITSGFTSLWNVVSGVFGGGSGSGGWLETIIGGAIGGLFGGSSGSSSAGATGGDYWSNKNWFAAKGAIVSGGSISKLSNKIVASPTFLPNTIAQLAAGGTIIGEGRKPEAVIPLNRMSNGELGVGTDGIIGGGCVNNIYIETPEGYTGEERQRVPNDNGGEDIVFAIIKSTAKNTTSPGSPMYKAMQNTFGASQVLTPR